MSRLPLIKCRLVEITGGEPLAQDHTPTLIESLLDDGYEVLLETNGSMDISGATHTGINQRNQQYAVVLSVLD